MYKIDKKDFNSQLRNLVVPIIIQNFMLAMVSTTDAIMLGSLSQNAMSSVSLAGQVQFILNMFISGIATGLGVMVAQYWGKGDKATIEKIVPIALRINVFVGCLFALAAIFIPSVLMGILTNDAQIIETGTSYLLTVAPSYLLCAVSQIYLTLLKSTGRTQISSRISSFAVIINIIFNALLIFGLGPLPAMGVKGAAVATSLARLYELVASAIESHKEDRIQVHWNHFFASAGRDLNRDFVKYSSPVLYAALVWGFAFSSYSVVLGHMGADAVAANSITSIVRSLLACVAHGFSGGTGVMIGNILGADELDKAKAYGNRLVKISAVVGLLICLAMIVISPAVVHFANITPEAKYYLQWMLIIAGFNLAAQSMNTVILDGIACAGGDAAFDMKGNIFAMWCFGVPLSFLAAFMFKMPPMIVYICASLDEIVKLPFMIKHHLKYVWLRNITR